MKRALNLIKFHLTLFGLGEKNKFFLRILQSLLLSYLTIIILEITLLHKYDFLELIMIINLFICLLTLYSLIVKEIVIIKTVEKIGDLLATINKMEGKNEEETHKKNDE